MVWEHKAHEAPKSHERHKRSCRACLVLKVRHWGLISYKTAKGHYL